MRRLTGFLALCLLAALTPLFTASGGYSEDQQTAFPGWIREWEGLRLRSLPLTEREKRFAAGFPGKIAPFTDGRRQFVFRWASRATRRMHPAAGCFRGSGYSIRPMPIQIDRAGRSWGCFEAARAPEILHVCERIFDDSGKAWTDVSSWYWATTLGLSEGPWWAVTKVERISARDTRLMKANGAP